MNSKRLQSWKKTKILVINSISAEIYFGTIFLLSLIWQMDPNIFIAHMNVSWQLNEFKRGLWIKIKLDWYL